MVVLNRESVMNNLTNLSRLKVEVLYDLKGWTDGCIRRLEDSDDGKAAWLLKKIIETMENPVVIKNLKDILDELDRQS
jgi:hypothetical protein